MELEDLIKTYFTTTIGDAVRIESQRINRRFFEIRKIEHLWDKHKDILSNKIELTKFIGTLNIITFKGAYNMTGKCLKCNSDTNFVSIGRGFKNFCSDICLKEYINQNNIIKFGGISSMCCEEVKQKVKITNNLRYGGNAPICSSEIKDKIKNTNKERYGYENVFQVPEFIKKAADTRLARYGYRYTLQNPVKMENMKKLFTEQLRWYNYEGLLDKEYYNRMVKRSENKFKNEISSLENFDKRGMYSTDYHLDHMFSKSEGFEQGILPYYIGHICNLEMIKCSKNLSKSSKCSISSEDLFKRIDEYNKNLK